jgi:hypothetical protein
MQKVKKKIKNPMCRSNVDSGREKKGTKGF